MWWMGKSHSPNMKTVEVIERSLLLSETHPTRMELHRSLPRKVEYQTFQKALVYLETHGTIMFNAKTIVYTGASNEKLRNYILNSREI